MVRSSSGLLPARTRLVRKKKSVSKLELQLCVKPAVMSLKPLAALVNPFKSGCSIFCNHPTNNIGLKIAIEKSKRRKADEEREAELMGEILEDILCRRGRGESRADSSPEPPPARPQLVLNLRRTTSQDTGRTSTGLQSSPSPCSQAGGGKDGATPAPRLPPPPHSKSEGECEEEVVRRRGKVRRKKKKADQEEGETAVADLSEPNNTLVSTCEGEEWEGEEGKGGEARPPSPPPPHSDLFDLRTLRHLRRTLSVTQVQAEYRRIWRRVLEEALDEGSAVLPHFSSEDVPPARPETWISYPRAFSRAAARFDLPISKALLNDMKPLQYLRDYVANGRKNMLLYDHVYKKYKNQDGYLSYQELMSGLGVVMGRELDGEEQAKLVELIGLEEDYHTDYRTWLGICAFTERVYGERFTTGKDMDMGKRQVIEKVDFESLEKRLDRLQLNPQISRLLQIISTS